MPRRLTRRRIIQGTAGLGIVLMLDKTGVAMSAKEGGAISLDLGGDMWTMREADKQTPIPASIPGSTYTTLLAAGIIPDPILWKKQ